MIISNLFRVKPRLSTTIPSTCLLSTKTRWYDRGNIDFLLNENPYLVSRASSHDKDTTRAILDSAEKFVQRWHSVDKIFDTVEPQFEPIGSGNVIMAPEAKDICDAYNEAGFNQLGRGGSCETSYTVQCAVACISNSAFSSGVLGLWTLTSCAANLLKTHGSPSLVDKFHSQMINGKWSGTMALSETQAGSSLQYITTKAERTAIPGTYSITGSKMWTSAGDHTMYENIVHMLLAKTDKGITLFLVPKFLVNDDGSLGARNKYEIGGINHKMGCRGLTNVYWSLDDAEGYLVGEEGKGLAAMFYMMDEMRIHVGLGASVCGIRGFQESLSYAMERTQGKGLVPGEQMPIIDHTDVKRMLLAQKGYSEGSLALCMFAASLMESSQADDQLLLSILTPVVKSYPSEWCLEANKWALQVLGGFGYTRDYPIEQLYRDNRLNMIHEGTHGIQALTLLGRSTRLGDGRGFQLLMSRMRGGVARARSLTSNKEPPTGSSNNGSSSSGGVDGGNSSVALCQALGEELEDAIARLEATTTTLLGTMSEGDVPLAMANAHEFLSMTGTTVVAWTWLEQAIVASASLSHSRENSSMNSDDDDDQDLSREFTRNEDDKDDDDDRWQSDAFYHGKLQAAKFFFRHEVVKTRTQAKLLSSLDDTVLTMNKEWF